MYKKLIIICSYILSGHSISYSQDLIISFENVNVIPMNKEEVLFNQRVIIKNDKIYKIEDGSRDSKEKISIKIGAAGKFLIPGLAETHYHLENDVENEFKLLVANGITTVRCMAERENQDQISVREKANSGKILAPLYFTTGPYLKFKNLESLNKVTEVVKYHNERGYDFLKVADNLPKEIYFKLLEETQKYGIPIVGHGQHKLPLEYSLRMKSIAHMEEFMNTFSIEQKQDSTFLKNAAREIKNSGVYVSPTLNTFEIIGRYANKEKFEILLNREETQYLPEEYLKKIESNENHYRTNPWFTAPESLIRLENELKWLKQFTKILHDEGVPLMAGSDTYGLTIPGFSLHDELNLINSSGLSPYETLKTATVIPARYLNIISTLGTINEGKQANLVLLSKNPLEHISNTKSIQGVMIKGKWLDRQNLDNLLLEVKNSYH